MEREKYLLLIKKTTEEISLKINRLHEEFSKGMIDLQQLKDEERLQHILFNNIKNRIAIEQQFIAQEELLWKIKNYVVFVKDRFLKI